MGFLHFPFPDQLLISQQASYVKPSLHPHLQARQAATPRTSSLSRVPAPSSAKHAAGSARPPSETLPTGPAPSRPSAPPPHLRICWAIVPSRSPPLGRGSGPASGQAGAARTAAARGAGGSGARAQTWTPWPSRTQSGADPAAFPPAALAEQLPQAASGTAHVPPCNHGNSEPRPAPSLATEARGRRSQWVRWRLLFSK